MGIVHWYKSRCRRPSLGIFRGILGHVFIHKEIGVDVCLCAAERMCPGVLECEGAHALYLNEQLTRLSEDKGSMVKYVSDEPFSGEVPNLVSRPITITGEYNVYCSGCEKHHPESMACGTLGAIHRVDERKN